MPDHEQLNEAKRSVAEAAESYQREKSPILKVLSEFRDSIIILRNKGAPLSAIVEVLRKANISVSLATVARFCRGLPRSAQARQRKRKRATSAPLTPKSGAEKVSQRQTPKEPAPSQTKSSEVADDKSGGPRIPNLATL